MKNIKKIEPAVVLIGFCIIFFFFSLFKNIRHFSIARVWNDWVYYSGITAIFLTIIFLSITFLFKK